MKRTTPESPDIFIAAGDLSGDLYGSLLARTIEQRLPYARRRGMGGPHMRAVGVELIADSSQWSRVGVFDALTAIPFGLKAYAQVKRILREERPSLFIAIDWGGINIRFIRYAHQLNIPTLYYIPPRCWDANANASEELVRCSTKIATPFAWSEKRLRAVGADVAFVGHPVLETARAARPPDEIRQSLNVRSDETLIPLLPGSRPLEIKYNLPVFLEVAQRIQHQRPSTRFVMALAPSVQESTVESHLQKRPVEGIHVLKNQTYDLLRAGDLAIVTSGTATLEAACLEAPMVIVYPTPWFFYVQAALMRKKIPTMIGLPNIILQDAVVPEIYGPRFTPQNLTQATLQLLENPNALETMRQRLKDVRRVLGDTGASARTADLVMELIQRERSAPVVHHTP